MNGKIGVFDSGIGGFTILEELKKVLPKEDYLFYADSANNPYGEKSDLELCNLTSNVVEYLIANDCKIIVIACNTATTRCIKYLRNKYKDMIFVGTEPAIKVACDRNFKNTLVMATPATINSERTNALIKDNKRDDENIYLVACEGLANAIETGNVKKQDQIIKSIYEEYHNKNIDSIVLGCTHYPHIKGLINSYFKDIPLLDGGNGVARETKKQLEIHGLLNDNGNSTVLVVNSLLK